LGAEPFIKMMAAVSIDSVPGPPLTTCATPYRTFIKRVEKKKLFG
jgi:hypothetical protein